MESYEEYKNRTTKKETSQSSLLSSPQSKLLYLVIVCGIILRVFYFLDVKDSPMSSWHKWQSTDNNFYHEWAEIVKEGNIWTDTILHPQDNWYLLASDNFFKDADTTILNKYADIKDLPSNERSKALWDGWYSGKQFHQEPFYAYFLASIFTLFGVSVSMVFLFQIILGLFSALLLYRISNRLFGSKVALLSLAFMLFYGPLVFYETNLLRAPFMVFFSLLLIEGFYWFIEKRGSYGSYFFYGVLIGICLLLKSIFILYLFMLTVFLFTKFKSNFSWITKRYGVLLIGILIALSPLMIRNKIVDPSPSLFSISSVGTMGFAQANNGRWEASLLSPETPKLIDKSDGKLLPAIYYTLQSHESLGSILKMFYAKAKNILLPLELSNNSNYYFGRKVSGTLRWFVVNFWVISIFGFSGLIHYLVKQKKWKEPLVWLIIINLVVLLAFFVNARLRLPLAVSLLPFSAYAIVELFSNALKQNKTLIIGIVLLSAFSFLNSFEGQDTARPSDYIITYQLHYKDKISENNKKENWAKSVELLEEHLSTQPDFINNLLNSSQISVTMQDRQFTGHFAEMYLNYSFLKEKTGDQVLATKYKKLSAMLKSSAIK